ncbi:MAG: hypothetical protein ACI83P_001391 [Janthinobacterium sp.]|jgi:hypothetical protein
MPSAKKQLQTRCRGVNKPRPMSTACPWHVLYMKNKFFARQHGQERHQPARAVLNAECWKMGIAKAHLLCKLRVLPGGIERNMRARPGQLAMVALHAGTLNWSSDLSRARIAVRRWPVSGMTAALLPLFSAAAFELGRARQVTPGSSRCRHRAGSRARWSALRRACWRSKNFRPARRSALPCRPVRSCWPVGRRRWRGRCRRR